MLSLCGIEDLSSVCRVCLDQPEESNFLDLDLIYDEEEQLNYYDCFAQCTNIHMNDEDDFPKKLCKSCGVELQMVYDFHKKIQNATKTIKQWQKELTTPIKMNNIECDKESILDINGEAILQIEALEDCKVDNCLAPLNEIEYNFSDGFEVLYDDIAIEDEDKSSTPEEEHINFEIYNPSDLTINEDITNIDGSYESTTKADESNTHSDQFADLIEKVTSEDKNLSSNIEGRDTILEELVVSICDDNIKDRNMVSSTQCLGANNFACEMDMLEEEANNSKRRNIPDKLKKKNDDGPPYLCELCGHSSPSKTLLASHRHRKHRATPLKFTCQKCGKGFDTNFRYQRHLQRLTCETYPEFTCEFCSKVCIGVANYNVHMRFHKKQYPYECQFCAKKFMMATHMNNHIKTKHENQRYICDYSTCGKLFQTKHALKTHTLSHSEILPYKCDFCDRMQPTKSRLRFHIKRSHGVDIPLEELDSMSVSKHESDSQIIIQSLSIETIKE